MGSSGNRLEGQIAVVTGGASGMGRATVLRFLDEGASVVIADLNEATGQETLGLAEARGGSQRVRFLRTDVSREDDVRAAVALAVDDFGRLDCMFNNAGIGGAIGSILETEAEDWDFTFAVLVRGVFFGIKHAGQVMRGSGRGGSIINTASIGAYSGGAGPIAYSAAKAAVVNLGMAAAVELAAHRIRVNTISPGGILTPLAYGDGGEELAEERMRLMQPWPCVGQGDHIAAAALFLASRESEFVTGHSLTVDGGLTAMGPNLAKAIQEDPEGRYSFTGLDKGTTGEPPVIRRSESAR